MQFLSPAQTGAVAHRARKLLQSRHITHHQYALLECLLWRWRKAGQAGACASYSSLQRLGRMARDTVWHGLARLEELGLVRRLKQRVRVGWVSRQATNNYVFLAPATESGQRTVYREIVIQTPVRPSKEVKKAQLHWPERVR